MHHDVAGLAVFAHHADRDKIRSAAPRSQRHRVFGAVERGANVVTHSPVDRDIGAHQALIRFYGLYRADLINGESGRACNCASGFNRNTRHVDPQIGALFRHYLGQPGSQLSHGQRIIARNIRDTESAAQIEFGHRDPPPGQNGGMQVQDPPRGEFEAGQVKDLGSDMRVQPQKLQFRAPNDGLQCRERGARRNREPKFLVLMGGGNELVGRGRDAGRHAHHTGTVTPRSRAIAVMRSISSIESMTMRPAPASMARSNSETDLLLPWTPKFSPGTPARSATANSPPVDTSRRRPSSVTQRAIATDRKALDA